LRTRAAQQRAFYQFASWTDRPSTRIVRLLADRIEARGMFSSVALLGNSIGGDLLLNVAVVDVIHDVSTGTGRIEVQAELIERRGRRLVAASASAPALPCHRRMRRRRVDAFSRASRRSSTGSCPGSNDRPRHCPHPGRADHARPEAPFLRTQCVRR
jgi:ABC-type uncharacterized transport system auxiliary subunit